MIEAESKKYSWAYITTSRLLSRGPCDLLFAGMRPGASGDTVTLYDGENTNGDIVDVLKAGTRAYTGLTYIDASREFKPPQPVYCRRGLYVVLGGSTASVFVQWRELGKKAGG